jgi:hypothetical protein
MLMVGVEGLVMLGERDRAAGLYPAVVDCYDRTGAICATFDDGRLVHRAAGIAAAAGRQWEVAEGHFHTALRQAAELPHRPEEAHTRRWYGQMLLERDGPGDRQQAQGLLQLAVSDYERMGMRRHVELAAALLDAS